METQIPSSLQPVQPPAARPPQPSMPGQPSMSQPLPQDKKTNLDIDPANLVYKTMPKGYIPPSFSRLTAKPAPSPVLSRPAAAPAASGAPAMAQSGAAMSAMTLEEQDSGKSRQWIKFGAIGAGAIVLVIIIIFVISKFISQPAQQTQNPPPAVQPVVQVPAPAPAVQPVPAQSQITDDWRQKYFGAAACANQDVCGDSADPDHDGLTNLDEFKLKTDPNNPDSSASGIADGDKVHVFNLDPLTNHTAGVAKFTDAGDLKYKYNSKTHLPFTDADLKQIAANIAQFGLHSPTTKTLTPDLIDFYTHGGTAAAPAGTASALDRDTQRAYTIKQISFALLKYFDSGQNYPDVTDFNAMIDAIKPLLAGKAINTTDPANTTPYVYSYQSVNGGTDFQIGYYSETQKQAVVFRAADARKLLTQDQATQRDTKRVNDLQQIAAALNLYSNDKSDPNNPQQKVFPSKTTWKTALAPKYIAVIPLDPSTNLDYSYVVSADSSTYTLQAVLELPPTGNKNYVCNQDGCDYQ